MAIWRTCYEVPSRKKFLLACLVLVSTCSFASTGFKYSGVIDQAEVVES